MQHAETQRRVDGQFDFLFILRVICLIIVSRRWCFHRNWFTLNEDEVDIVDLLLSNFEVSIRLAKLLCQVLEC